MLVPRRGERTSIRGRRCSRLSIRDRLECGKTGTCRLAGFTRPFQTVKGGPRGWNEAGRRGVDLEGRLASAKLQEPRCSFRPPWAGSNTSPGGDVATKSSRQWCAGRPHNAHVDCGSGRARAAIPFLWPWESAGCANAMKAIVANATARPIRMLRIPTSKPARPSDPAGRQRKRS